MHMIYRALPGKCLLVAHQIFFDAAIRLIDIRTRFCRVIIIYLNAATRLILYIYQIFSRVITEYFYSGSHVVLYFHQVLRKNPYYLCRQESTCEVFNTSRDPNSARHIIFAKLHVTPPRIAYPPRIA